MPQHQCSVCNDEFEEQYFDREQNKCILHSHKDETNGWYTVNQNNEKEWDTVKVRNFWHYIQKKLDELYQNDLWDSSFTPNTYIFRHVIFPKYEPDYEYIPVQNNLCDMGTNFYSFGVYQEEYQEQREEVNTFIERIALSFENCIFLDIADFEKYKFQKPIQFINCIFTNKILLNKVTQNNILFLTCDFGVYNFDLRHSTIAGRFEIKNAQNINNINLSESSFDNKVKIQACEIKGTTNFTNTKFNDLADFHSTIFYNVIFKKAEFNGVSVFNQVEFRDDVDFKYTQFVGNSLFIDTVFTRRLNLRNTTFGANPNFLAITSKKDTIREVNVENRETARIIKSSFDGIHNIIEANKFYALEMKERAKELDFFKKPFEWIIFKLHGLSSNHSQDWSLVLLWIIIFGIINSTYAVVHHSYLAEFTLVILPFIILFILLLIFNETIKVLHKKIILTIMILIPFSFSLVSLNSLSKVINPLSKLSENITFVELFFKATLAYLVYQFIVSVRQDTRRK